MVKVLVDPDGSPAVRARSTSGNEWTLLATVGFVFGLVAVADIGLALIPVHFGSSDWEFGTVTTVMNNLPLFVVGLAFVTMAGFGRDSRVLLTLGAVVSVVALVGVAGLAVLFFRTQDEARKAVTDPVLRMGMSQSITRTTVQLVVYLVGFTAFGWTALKGARAG